MKRFDKRARQRSHWPPSGLRPQLCRPAKGDQQQLLASKTIGEPAGLPIVGPAAGALGRFPARLRQRQSQSWSLCARLLGSNAMTVALSGGSRKAVAIDESLRLVQFAALAKQANGPTITGSQTRARLRETELSGCKRCSRFTRLRRPPLYSQPACSLACGALLLRVLAAKRDGNITCCRLRLGGA